MDETHPKMAQVFISPSLELALITYFPNIPPFLFPKDIPHTKVMSTMALSARLASQHSSLLGAH